MMLKSILQRVLAALGISLLLAGPAAGAGAARAVPALWAVSDADTTVYLFGTIHLLPENYSGARTSWIRRSTARSNSMVETIVDDRKPQKCSPRWPAWPSRANLPPIVRASAAGEACRARGRDQAERHPAADLRPDGNLGGRLHAARQPVPDMGLKGGEGVEAVLRAAASPAQGKPIGELETNREQLGFFDALPENAQRQLLEGAIDEPKNMRKDFHGHARCLDARRRCEIAKTFNRDLSALARA